MTLLDQDKKQTNNYLRAGIGSYCHLESLIRKTKTK